MNYKTELGVLCDSILEMLESNHVALIPTTLHEHQQILGELASNTSSNAKVDCSSRETLPIFVEFKEVERVDDVTEGGATKLFDFLRSTEFFVNVDDIALAKIYVRTPYIQKQRPIAFSVKTPVGYDVNFAGVDFVKSSLKQWRDWSELQTNPLHQSSIEAPKIIAKPRLEVFDGGISIDGESFAFNGGPITTERLTQFFRELVESRDFVTMKDHSLKTRDLDSQPDRLTKLFDDTGSSSAGFRIKKEWF